MTTFWPCSIRLSLPEIVMCSWVEKVYLNSNLHLPLESTRSHRSSSHTLPFQIWQECYQYQGEPIVCYYWSGLALRFPILYRVSSYSFYRFHGRSIIQNGTISTHVSLKKLSKLHPSSLSTPLPITALGFLLPNPRGQHWRFSRLALMKPTIHCLIQATCCVVREPRTSQEPFWNGWLRRMVVRRWSKCSQRMTSSSIQKLLWKGIRSRFQIHRDYFLGVHSFLY